MNTDQNFTDKEILDDILSSQKHITDIYNTFSNECVNQQLQSDMLKILGEEHNMQFTAARCRSEAGITPLRRRLR